MKTTFLVYKDILAEKKELRVASHDEWDAIMKANKGLPAVERRIFYKDCINEGSDGLDCMYIEVSLDKYRILHTQQIKEERTRKDNAAYRTCSMDEPLKGNEELSCEDYISDGIDYAEYALDELMMKDLRAELKRWEPYGNELLDSYLSGDKRLCTKEMSKKIGITEQYFRRKKKEFESIVKTFLIF